MGPALRAADGVIDEALADVNEETTSTFDANYRLLTETKDADGTDDDRFTRYEYGPGATTSFGGSGTQQTKKTVREGLNDSGDVVERTTYAYNLQGRLAFVSVDADGDGEGPVVHSQYDYDTDGSRIRTSEGGVLTLYLNDKHNPTGYSQVLEEKTLAGAVLKTYTLGHDVLAQVDGSTVYLLRDGHGSTRGLVDATGTPLSGQIYRYDAFGVRLDSADALTSLLFSGEQTDPTGLQYLRARYYDPATGRFTSLDPFAGVMEDPQSLHKYLYCHADAVNGVDPSGAVLLSLILGAAFDSNLRSMAINGYDAAYNLAESGLDVMNAFYNLKILIAMSADPFPSAWATTAMSVLPVVGMIMNDGGPSIKISQIMNMGPEDWSQYIRNTFGYLSPSHQAGRVAENLAAGWLKSKGYTDIIAIQNARGHGVDLMAKHSKTGRWVAFEVKGHIKEGVARLSNLQQFGAEGFARDVLRRIDEGMHGWANVSRETREAIESLRAYINPASGRSLRGVVINVENALDAVLVVIKTKVWKVFV